MRANRFTTTSRLICLPTTADGCCPTITASYGGPVGPANMISCKHYPKSGVGVIYETH